MQSYNKTQLVNFVGLATLTIILAGVLFSIDLVYIGMQEYFLERINPTYEPDLRLADRVIIWGSIAIVLGGLLYLFGIWLLARPKIVQKELVKTRVLDTSGAVDFNLFQEKIFDSLSTLKDLFLYLMIVVIVSGLFPLIRFLWITTRHSFYAEFVIHHLLRDIPGLLLNSSVYLALALVTTYVIITSLHKYFLLQTITLSYSNAMEKVRINFAKLMVEEGEEDNNTRAAAKDEEPKQDSQEL